jgi:hypothetical protein
MPHARQDRAKLSAASGWLVGLSLAGALIGWGWAWVGIRAAVRHYEPGTMALGWLILGELPAPAAFVGGVVTLCGLVIVDRLGRATAWPPAAVPDGLG